MLSGTATAKHAATGSARRAEVDARHAMAMRRMPSHANIANTGNAGARYRDVTKNAAMTKAWTATKP
jgi:hypothetical protein